VHGFSNANLPPTTTSTIALFSQSTHTRKSATPFQPLPTNTSTLTPTASETPLPTATDTPVPTNTPRPVPTHEILPAQPPVDGIPSSASIYGVYGHFQTYNLSCESRSASDWAAYYGFSISENAIQFGLPISDNPNRGFVGDVNGTPGQIPPHSYGVHAEPIAALLREYGVSATAGHGLSLNDIKRKIASGDPVIAWVIGSVWWGYPIDYTAEDGSVVRVANFEHTVIVVGYDEYTVTVVDGGNTYSRAAGDFMSSFSVLGNMAVYRP
jgi:uncharacterized protein YvpB